MKTDDKLLEAIIHADGWDLDYCSQPAFFKDGDRLYFSGFIVHRRDRNPELLIAGGRHEYGDDGSGRSKESSFEVFPGQKIEVVDGVAIIAAQVHSEGGRDPHHHPIRLDFYCINNKLKLNYELLGEHGANHNDYGGGTGN